MNDNLRGYTKRNLKKTYLERFFSNIGVTGGLIIANIFFFVIINILFSINKDYLEFIALRPAFIFEGRHLWTLFTSMFMHSGFAHLFVNMLSLFFIGVFVERLIGKKRFFFFYILSGLFAGLFFSFFAVFLGSSELGIKIFGDPNVSGLGASGAIFGLLGILAILTPKAKVYLILGPLVAIILQSVLGNAIDTNPLLNILMFIIQIYFFLALFAMFSFNSKISKFALPLQIPFWLIPLVAILPLVILGLFVELPIGNMAHFGGFLAGAIYGVYLRAKYPKKVRLLNKMILS